MLSRPANEKKRNLLTPVMCERGGSLYFSLMQLYVSPLFSAFSCLLYARSVLFILSPVLHLQSILHVQYLANERWWSFNFKIFHIFCKGWKWLVSLFREECAGFIIKKMKEYLQSAEFLLKHCVLQFAKFSVILWFLEMLAKFDNKLALHHFFLDYPPFVTIIILGNI